MLRSTPAVLALAVALPALALPSVAIAQQPATSAAPAALAALKADYLAAATDVEQKLLALADAIPEDKYDWRPADGVRSVGEVFLHVAGGNYYLVGMTGVTPPADVPKDIEKVTGKKAIREWMEKSFAHVHAALAAATPETMSKEIDFFGNKTTGRGIFLADYGHMSEHLGQAIAYARSIGVTPPWSKN